MEQPFWSKEDEPIVNKHCFEALDQTLRDVIRSSNPRSMEQPFRLKAYMLILCLLAPHLLTYGRIILKLTKNMRLIQTPSIGDEYLREPNYGEEKIDIPSDLLVNSTSVDLISAIVKAKYIDFQGNMRSPSYFQERAILALTHDVVDDVNDYILSLIQGKEKIYFSADSICKTEGHMDMKLPNHALKVKVGALVMLLHNIDQFASLCNSIRLIITQLDSRIVEKGVIILAPILA
ncbi:hypothetical protein V2J09_000613 [Rumex salicifolius]